jgi:hypothetical protein
VGRWAAGWPAVLTNVMVLQVAGHDVREDRDSVSGFLCDPRRYGRSAGTVTRVCGWCGVDVVVEALAEGSAADPVRVPRVGGGSRVRHLAALVGCPGCPSRRTLTRRSDGHGWGREPAVAGAAGVRSSWLRDEPA